MSNFKPDFRRRRAAAGDARLCRPRQRQGDREAAKAAGTVGEQADGYLGIVSGADGAVTAAVNEINAGRRQVYTQTATKSGVTPDAAGQATGAQLIAKVPAGQFIKPLGGGWTKK